MTDMLGIHVLTEYDLNLIANYITINTDHSSQTVPALLI